ncbi:GAF and ANTAR domain-containing protein [Yaniella flava]|uniref:GAF and ANTAR domain-containing protein n=1 Tax=Yaniella flava TaxID=287930 RepID=A0ABP5FEX4_9MICC|nr:GAF and ANTAR domain-containing protein [Micrococcaceae bacterium]
MDSTPANPSAAESLHSLLASNHEISEFLNELAKLAASQVIGGENALCGILLSRNKRTTVVGHSSQYAKQLDEIQAGFDEGPCLEAQATQMVLQVSDARHETRWPDYMATVRDSEIRSVLAVPLTLDDKATGALNFYAINTGTFDEESIAHAQRFASLASLAVTVALRIVISEEVAQDRQKAMESRTAIDIAVGVIMAQKACSQEEAFDILTEVSSHQNIKVRDLARNLVASIGKTQPTTVFEE